jgi:hypothetical protein
MFPGSQRLFELADELNAIQVEVLCWCGLPGRFNSRDVMLIDTRVTPALRLPARRHWRDHRGARRLPGMPCRGVAHRYRSR